ncbi:MAG: hypothetical protein R3B82_19980 [Sandaracinaceae bacterium]
MPIRDRIVELARSLGIPWALVLASWLFAATQLGVQLDEAIHIRQARAILRGELALDPELTTLPGLHVLVAGAFASLGHSLLVARLPGLLGGLLFVGAGYAAARSLGWPRPGWRAAQLSVLPLAAPLFGLVYTDVLAAGLVMTALALALRAHPRVAALALLAALSVRQTTICFAPAVMLVALRAPEPRRDPLTLGLVALPFVAFGALVWTAGGVALGDPAHHTVGLYPANVPVQLAMLACLFAPLVATEQPRVRERLRAEPVLIACLVVAASLLAAGAPLDHPYNQDGAVLANRALGWLFGAPAGRTTLVLGAAIGVLVLTGLRLPAPLDGRAIVLALLAGWLVRALGSQLVEPRYFLVPAAFLIVARPTWPRWADVVTVLGFAALTAYFLRGMDQRWWFPL